MAGVVPENVPRASVQLWDQFEALNQKVAQGLLVCRDFADFLSRRAAIDEEYATKLQALAKEPMGQSFLSGGLSSWFSSGPKEPPISKESSLLRVALERPQAVALDQSAFLLEFAQKIKNEIVKPLTTFLNAKEARRKEIAPEAQKWLRTLQDAKDDVLLRRSNYQKTMQTVDAAGEALEREEMKMGYRDEKALKAAEQKLEQAQEKGRAAEKEYMDAVDLANQIAREVFQTHLPSMLDELQHIEFVRQGTLIGALNVLSGLQDAYAPFLQEKYADMVTIIKRHSMEKDWNEWAVTVANKSSTVDTTVIFEPYPSRYMKSTAGQWSRPPDIEPGKPLIKGVVDTILGDPDAASSPVIQVGPTSAPEFDEEIIDPFNYRSPAGSDYVAPPESRPGPKQIATPVGMRSISPNRVVQGTSPPSSVLAAAAAVTRKPSPQRVPSGLSMSSDAVDRAPLPPPPSEQQQQQLQPPPPPQQQQPYQRNNRPPSITAAPVVALKVAPIVVKPIAKPTASVTPPSVLAAAITAQKSGPSAAAMRDRSMSDARPLASASSQHGVAQISPRGGGGGGMPPPGQTRAPSLTVAPRVVPPLGMPPPQPSTPAPTAPISPRSAHAQPTWERKVTSPRPASERKEY